MMVDDLNQALSGFRRRGSYLLICVQEEHVQTGDHSQSPFNATSSALRPFLFAPVHGSHGG